MVDGRGEDCGALYREKRQELLRFLRTRGAPDLEVVVPATPAWSVRAVVAHLVGIAADLNAQRFAVTDPDEWTARQVAQRGDRSLEELAGEWDRESPRFEEGLRLFGYEVGSHFVGDLLQHTADVYHALGRGPLDDDRALAVALDFYLTTFDRALTDAGRGSVQVSLPGAARTLGTGAVVASLSTGRVEAFRAFGGRRCAAQLRALDWTGDADAVLDLISPYPLPDGPVGG